MKTCPRCNEVNGDNNMKCFKCGANLPEPIFKDTKVSKKFQSTGKKKNSEKIISMAEAVCIIGILLAVVLGFIFQTATIHDSYSGYTTEFSFNWTLCIATAIGSICFTIILVAMSYITKAIEEK